MAALVIIPDLDFYGNDIHTALIRENRLIAAVRNLEDLPPKLRRAVLTMRIIASCATFEDAQTIAKRAGLRPDPLREENAFNKYVDAAMAEAEPVGTVWAPVSRLLPLKENKRHAGGIARPATKWKRQETQDWYG